MTPKESAFGITHQHGAKKKTKGVLRRIKTESKLAQVKAAQLAYTQSPFVTPNSFHRIVKTA